MATQPDPQYISQMEAALNADPEYSRLRRIAMSSPRPSNVSAAKNRGMKVLEAAGLEMPHDYGIHPNGTIQRQGYLQRNQDWIGAAAAAPMGYAALFGPAGIWGSGAAANAAASPFQQVGPTTTSLADLGSGVDWANIENQVVDRVANTGRSRITSLLTDPDFWATIGGLGLGLYGANKQAAAAEDANRLAEQSAKLQADALQKALDLQKEMFEKDRMLQAGLYGQNRADLAPYRAAGQGSVGKLSYLLGVPGFESGPTTYQPGPDVNPFTQSMLTPTSVDLSVPQTRSMAPAVQPEVVTGAPITEQTAQTVRLQGPDGSVRDVPMNQAEFFLSRGARRIA